MVRLGNRLSTSRDSIGFFFYAGHGVHSNGVNYLIPAIACSPVGCYDRDGCTIIWRPGRQEKERCDKRPHDRDKVITYSANAPCGFAD